MPKTNWGSVGSGAASGAATGAAFGPWGALAGGVIGGGLGFLSGSGTKKEKLKPIPTGTPGQQQFGENLINWLNQSQGQGGGFGLANQYDQNLLGNGPEAFNQFAQPYNQQFEQKVLPGIAERFGGMGALSSSGFGQALGGAASDFQSQLAQLFSSLQGQAAGRQQNQFQGLSQLALGYEPFAYHQKPGGATSAGGFAQGFDPSSLSGLFSMFKDWKGSGSGGGYSGDHSVDFDIYNQNKGMQ